MSHRHHHRPEPRPPTAGPPTARPPLKALGATAGATLRARPAAAIAVWAAVLLALLTGAAPAGPLPAPAGLQPAPAGTVSADAPGASPGTGRQTDDACATPCTLHADDACTTPTPCTLQPPARHEPHGERTPPHGPFATLADDAVTAPRRPARPTAPPSPAAFPTDPAPADRGRAPPPTPTGT
ncbi:MULTISPECIES: hypothetical protein [unclassified Streptomyces]|uniref:hypothetical protein n=1 Tax=unclassified Streptomyces TaxID=2593676 RepID=UPI0033BD6791